MSDDKISLEFLGEQMVRMQSDLRGVRADQARLETDLRADIGAVTTELTEVKTELADVRSDVRRLDGKVDHLAASVDARFDRIEASVNARFEQVQTTMATNLEVVLKAIDSSRS